MLVVKHRRFNFCILFQQSCSDFQGVWLLQLDKHDYMNDLHEGLSQACFISSVRPLKLCRCFLSHSKTLIFLSQALETVCIVFWYLVKTFPMKKSEYLDGCIFLHIFLVFSPIMLMLYILQTTVLWAKIRKCSFQAFSTELLSVSMSPLRVSHKFQLLFHFILFSILEDGCCIKVFRILFYYYYWFFFLFYKLSIWLSLPFNDLLSSEEEEGKTKFQICK